MERTLQHYLQHNLMPILAYWGRKTVSKAVNKSVRGFRKKPRIVKLVAVDLSKKRINFYGPFLYQSEVRNKPLVKCYVCVYVSFCHESYSFVADQGSFNDVVSSWPQTFYMHQKKAVAILVWKCKQHYWRSQ